MTNAGRLVAGPALIAACALVAVGLLPRSSHGVTIDDAGAMRLGMRAYTAVRLGTEKMGGSQSPLAFAHSSAGHVRQHRSFISLDFSHDILRYAQDGSGLARAFGLLDPSVLQYTLQYRGEFEGIFDYGPSEYSDYSNKMRAFRRDVPELPVLGLTRKVSEETIRRTVSRQRRIGRQRHRLFMYYVDIEKGPLFLRIGKQVLAWGETDVFRLLDNINPLDDSFGGFLIPLDERRLPIEMIRASYHFGSVWRLADTFLEGFLATGNRVSQWPGAAPGGPWVPGGLSSPNESIRRETNLPSREDFRGGARLVFTLEDITFTLSHYYTYLDVPGVRFRLPGCKPRPPAGQPCSTFVNGELATNAAGLNNEIVADTLFPRVPITGVAATFALPSLYTIVRTEAAYFQDAPYNRQGQGPSARTVDPLGSAGAKKLRARENHIGGLDPFVYPAFLDLGRRGPVQGRMLQLDTFNMSIGFDVNRFIRALNPRQTFFFSTQFFYKHVFDSPGDLVLPVPHRNIRVAHNAPIIGKNSAGCGNPNSKNNNRGNRSCALRPRLYRLADDQFLQTLLITTAYAAGRIVPSFGMFYDWQGAWVVQPGVTFIRDPFRFTMDYSSIFGSPTGQFGTILDRDNVRFQAGFVF